MTRVTSKDVARAAGVSQTTVSLVLNGKRQNSISMETQQAVRAAAGRLGYVPFAPARSLRRGRTDIVLCVMPDMVVAEATDRLNDVLSNDLATAGLQCLFSRSAGSQTPLTTLWQHVQPDALIAYHTLSGHEVKAAGDAGIPLLHGVLADTPGRPQPIGLDQEGLGRLQAEHLASLGHQYLAVATVDDPRESSFSAPRLRGVQEAARTMGLPEPLVTTVGADPADTAARVRAWSRRESPITAIAAFNDLVAMEVIAGARQSGLQVPHDLAVIGIDDIPAAALFYPPLTTVSFDLVAAGHRLSTQVLEILGETALESTHAPVGAFVIRRSTT